MSIERTTIRTPLGLRFRDAATERPVTDGLSVRVWPADRQGRPVTATRTRSEAWAAHGLAHLRGYERSGTGRPPARPYVVDVRDERGRIVPVQIRVDLPPDPADTVRGLYSILETPEDATHASGDEFPDPACYLFPSVARERSGGLAAVRADLRTPSGDAAAHAVLVVSQDEETWFGLADEDGRVAVLFPYPALELEALPVWATNGDNDDEGDDGGPSGGNGGAEGDGGPPGGDGGPLGGNGNGGNGSPGNGPGSSGDGPGSNGGTSVGGSGRPISTRSWELTVSVRYAPDEHVVASRSDRPFLTSLLNQSHGEIQTDLQGGFQSAINPSLDYGRSLTLRSHDPSALSQPSHLVVRSAR